MSLDMSSDLSLLSRAFETPFLFNFTRSVLKTDPFQLFGHSRFCIWKYPLFHEVLDEHTYPKVGRVTGPGMKLKKVFGNLGHIL